MTSTSLPLGSEVRDDEPLVFVVGGPKTATTALCGVLNCHPDVFVMCEVGLNTTPISRWGRKLLREHADLGPFFGSGKSDPLESYRAAQRYLSSRGYAGRLFGDKFVGIDSGFAKEIAATRVIFTVRHLPEWLAKDSVRTEYKFDCDIVPVAVQYTRHFIESFQLQRVLHVRFCDFLGDHKGVVDSIWRFLGIAQPEYGQIWWQSVGHYPAGDPKAAINWWRGHASSAIKPQRSDTRVAIAEIPFWREILPIFDRYYEAAWAGAEMPADEISADMLALNAIAANHSVPIAEAYAHNYSKSTNADVKSARRKSQNHGWKSTLSSMFNK